MLKKFFSISLIFTLVFSVAAVHSVKAEVPSGDVNQTLNYYVSKHGVVLDDAAAAQVAAVCVNLQNQVANNQITTSLAVRKRLSAYADLQNEIKSLELRMMRQGVDSSELDLLIGKIQQKLDAISIMAADFGTLADYIRLIDCQKHPEQFKAGLKELKELQARLINKSKELRFMTVNSPRETFTPLKDRLSL